MGSGRYAKIAHPNFELEESQGKFLVGEVAGGCPGHLQSRPRRSFAFTLPPHLYGKRNPSAIRRRENIYNTTLQYVIHSSPAQTLGSFRLVPESCYNVFRATYEAGYCNVGERHGHKMGLSVSEGTVTI